LKQSEGKHKHDDHQLQHDKVGPPELSAVFVVPHEEGEEDEADGEEGQHEVGDCIVEEVDPQAEQHDNEGGVAQAVAENLLDVVDKLLGYGSELDLFL
jgi:hypothetical protein